MTSLREFEDDTGQLSRAGLRVTAPRLAVLSALRARPHADVDTLAAIARAQLGTISVQAVYDILNALTGVGLARRIEPGGSRALYERRAGDNHHHLVCRNCRTVVDVDCIATARPCLEPNLKHGFALDEAEITFWGLCPACQHNSDEKTGP